VLPATIRALKAAYPAIGLDLRELNQPEQLRGLEHDELDFGFVYRPFDGRTFASLDVIEERLVVAVAVGHRLARAERIVTADLADESLVLFSRAGHSVFSALVDEELRAASITTVAAFSARDPMTALALVANGLGVTFLPEHAVVPRRDVSYVLLDSRARLQFAAVWSALAEPRLVRQRFLDALVATLPNLGFSPTSPVPS
jgi:DNA-binding transcriptional LysR family regulator